MRKVAKNILTTALSVPAIALSRVRYMGHDLVSSFATDIRDGRAWFSENVPQAALLVIEKWLGLWYALLVAALLGMAGRGTVQFARWSGSITLLAETIPRAITWVGVFGILATLNAGLVMFGVLTVTAIRLLLWLRNTILNMWKQHTPPYVNEDEESENPFRVTSDEERNTAREKALSFGIWGSCWFMGITSALLYLEQHYEKQLYGATSNPQLGSIAEILNTAFWVIDVENLILTLAPSTTQTEIILFLLMVVVPGIWFVFSARNLLFVTEAGVREQLRKVRAEGLFQRTTLYLVVAFFYFTVTAIFAAARMLSGS